MADDETTEAEPTSRNTALLPILIGVGGLVLGVLGGGGAGYFMMKSEVDSLKLQLATGGTGTETAADVGGTLLTTSSEVVQLGQFTVNLRDSAGGRLLQMELALEAGGAASRLVEEREVQLRSAVLMLASDYTFLELEGLEGKLAMRDEIQRRVNAVLSPEKVDRVYFTSFVVQ